MQDVLRRSVILLQADDFGFGKILFEFEDVADVGAPPGIDRLVFVADGAHIVARSGQHAHEFVLRAVGVLIFVDEEILEAAVVIVAHGSGGLQQANGFEQQVIEVEGVGLAQLFAVFLEKMGNALGLRIG